MGYNLFDKIKGMPISFSDEEISLIMNRFRIDSYFLYEHINKDKSFLKYKLPCIPIFMQNDDWKFVCSGVDIFISKFFVKETDIVEYTHDIFLAGIKYVDGSLVDFCIKSSHSEHTDLSDLMDKLLSIMNEYELYCYEHQVHHISI